MSYRYVMKRGNGMKIFSIVSVIVLATFYLYYRYFDLQVSVAGDGTVDAGVPDAVPGETDPAEDPAPEAWTEVPAEAGATNSPPIHNPWLIPSSAPLQFAWAWQNQLCSPTYVIRVR